MFQIPTASYLFGSAGLVIGMAMGALDTPRASPKSNNGSLANMSYIGTIAKGSVIGLVSGVLAGLAVKCMSIALIALRNSMPAIRDFLWSNRAVVAIVVGMAVPCLVICFVMFVLLKGGLPRYC